MSDKMSESKCLCGKGSLDPNVLSVMEKHKTRAEVGMEKYGVDTTRDDVDLRGWLNHLQEELMDANVYIEATMSKLDKLTAELDAREKSLAEREKELNSE